MNLTLLRRYVYLPAQPHRSNFYCVSEMKCPALSIKQHHLSHTCDDENALGSECVFSCSAGYRLVGSSTMLCGQNKSWQPTASPRCGKYVACVGVGSVIMGLWFRNRTGLMQNGRWLLCEDIVVLVSINANGMRWWSDRKSFALYRSGRKTYHIWNTEKQKQKCLKSKHLLQNLKDQTLSFIGCYALKITSSIWRPRDAMRCSGCHGLLWAISKVFQSFRFRTDPVGLKLLTHSITDLRVGT